MGTLEGLWSEATEGSAFDAKLATISMAGVGATVVSQSYRPKVSEDRVMLCLMGL